MRKEDPFIRGLRQTLREENLVAPGMTVLIGVSAGPDSAALAAGLQELQEELYLRLLVAHFNHGLRGKEAEVDAEWVRDFCRRLDLEFICGQAKDSPRGNVEEWARRRRYEFLFAAAAEKGAERVAVGHHADDQAETVLMNLLRGAGPAGLAGMAPIRPGEPPHEKIFLIRPLLCHRRLEILDYLRRRGLDFRQDPSNLDMSRLRNRLRHEILPRLEAVQPAVISSLLHASRAARAESEAVHAAAESWLKAYARRISHGVLLEGEALERAARGFRLAVLREALRETAGSLQGFGMVHFEALEKFAAGEKKRGSLNLPGVRVRKEGSRISLEKRTGKTEERDDVPPQLELPVPGETRWSGPGGREHIIRAEIVLRAAQRPDVWQTAWLSREKISSPLSVRSRRPGDRYQPFGFAGRRKVKDVMNELMIAPWARDRWPLICEGEQILWVPGLRPAHPLPPPGSEVVQVSITPRLTLG